jgi:antitoxin component of RelBE/YafQ-DinJ toxin-antitoxin module
MAKGAMNFRPSAEDRRTMEKFSQELGITYADVIRLALRQLAKRGLSVDPLPGAPDADPNDNPDA